MFFPDYTLPNLIFLSYNMVLSSLTRYNLVFVPLKKWCCLVIQQLWFPLIWCGINKRLLNFVYNIYILINAHYVDKRNVRQISASKEFSIYLGRENEHIWKIGERYLSAYEVGFKVKVSRTWTNPQTYENLYSM